MSPSKTERFEMRLDEDTLSRIDKWRSQQDDLPTRSEAMRQLVEAGLERSSHTAITFRPGERVIITMLADLYKHLGVDGEVNAELLMKVLLDGHLWALNWQATELPSALFHGHEDTKEDVAFVVDVLDMWDFIETAHRDLSDSDKARIAADVNGPIGKSVRFRGFDANDDREVVLLSIGRFLVEDLKRFASTFKGRDFNSHFPMAQTYRKMLRVFEPIRKTILGTAPLNTEQLIKILNAAN